MRMHNEQLMSHHNMANDQLIPVYHKTTRKMTGCYGTIVLRSISSWILSLLPRGKSSCGNTCCQLFITDKGFLHVVPMKRKSEVFIAVKIFAKEIGALNAIVCDMAKEQMSAELKGFLNDIGTTLCALEEGTP